MSQMHIEALLEAPWALLPRTLSRIVDATRQGTPMAQIIGLDGPHEGATRVGSVAVIPVYGVIEYRSDWMTELFGGVGLDTLRETLRSELADPAVKAVVLDIDSPGGTVSGMTEFAAELRSARGGAKPIVAVANTLSASAAYWMASQADELVVTPSGQVGSIGVYAIHQEVSRMLDEMGVTTTIVSAGPHKTEGNEFEPLTDEAKAELQSRVDASYQTFLADVAAGRRVPVAQVEADFGGGRVLIAKDALRTGMVDRIATLPTTITRLGRSTGSSGRTRAEAFLDLEANAISRHKTETDDGAWDGPANEARLPSGDGAEPALHAAHAWVDENADPNLKGSYKFIHHEVAEDGTVGAANLTGCSTGIGYLNRPAGSSGRPQIPDGDRSGVHRHLAGHLTDAGRDAPPLSGETPFRQRVVALASEAAQIAERASERARLRAKEGRPAFSTTTETALRATRDALDSLLAGDPQPPGDPAPVQPPKVADPPKRFASREDWLRYLENNT